MHHPVLLKEAVAGLRVKSNRRYIDATVGEGGHLLEILRHGGKVLGIDRDEHQIRNLKLALQKKRIILKRPEDLILVAGNFADLENIAKEHQFLPVEGILFDLGLSMWQIENSKRGFSYKKKAEVLDMRLDLTSKLTAASILKSYSQEQLYEILAHLGEEIHALEISQAIIETRRSKNIQTVGDLIQIIDDTLGFKSTKTYARVFQALRIAVNDELNCLKRGLKSAFSLLKEDGRIVIITFQSLEDRLVKNFIKEKKLVAVNKKVIRSKNMTGFARSAKLRIISKKV